MNKNISLLKNKNYITSNSWIQKGIILLIASFFANHLMEIDSFPFSDSYSFPLFSIFTSLVIGGIILIIADLNFKYFESKYFIKQINTSILIYFLLSTFGYITILYIPSFYVVVWLQDGDFGFYYLIVGLSITLLISALTIIVLYAQKTYNLHKLETLTGKLVIQQGKKKIIINISDISYFYSKNKIVYVIQSDGQIVSTDFTLSEIENNINSHLFIRANRQTLIHSRSVKEIKAIEYGKLLVTLVPTIFSKQIMEIVISRYKKKDFNEWFKNKQEL